MNRSVRSSKAQSVHSLKHDERPYALYTGQNLEDSLQPLPLFDRRPSLHIPLPLFLLLLPPRFVLPNLFGVFLEFPLFVPTQVHLGPARVDGI
jgi:hypothetical protein